MHVRLRKQILLSGAVRDNPEKSGGGNFNAFAPLRREP